MIIIMFHNVSYLTPYPSYNPVPLENLYGRRIYSITILQIRQIFSHQFRKIIILIVILIIIIVENPH
jgi:hypothetical protein